jgi:hypothetical protein
VVMLDSARQGFFVNAGELEVTHKVVPKVRPSPYKCGGTNCLGPGGVVLLVSPAGGGGG